MAHHIALADLGALVAQLGTSVLVYPPRVQPWQESRIYVDRRGGLQLQEALLGHGVRLVPADELAVSLASKTAEGEPLPWVLRGYVPTVLGQVRVYEVLPAAGPLALSLRAGLAPGPDGADGPVHIAAAAVSALQLLSATGGWAAEQAKGLLARLRERHPKTMAELSGVLRECSEHIH